MTCSLHFIAVILQSPSCVAVSPPSSHWPVLLCVSSLPRCPSAPVSVMVASQADLYDAAVPMHWRDYCSHLLIPLNKCRHETVSMPWKCGHERHAYEQCQFKESTLHHPTLHYTYALHYTTLHYTTLHSVLHLTLSHQRLRMRERPIR